ncbi:Solanesyl-diphosphate synthase 1 mitochondrial [Bienertia sinuspersici]
MELAVHGWRYLNENHFLAFRILNGNVKNDVHQSGILYNFRKLLIFLLQDQPDPFSLVGDELSLVAERLQSKVVAEVPKLASAAEYFFKMGVEGKRFRPTVLLLMATALNMPVSMSSAVRGVDDLEPQLRRRQQCIVEITEMIHVSINLFISFTCDFFLSFHANHDIWTAKILLQPHSEKAVFSLAAAFAFGICVVVKVGSLLHDDILDYADTRRGVSSLNSVMGNKFSVLAGDFMLSRACVAIGSLKSTEVASLLGKVLEHLVIGETMQMTKTSEQSLNMQYYMDKTYYKTTSLVSNGCKAIALLAGQTAEVATLVHEYGKNLGLAYQLIDDVLDFTGTSTPLGKGSLSDTRHVRYPPLLLIIEHYTCLKYILWISEGLWTHQKCVKATPS